MDGVAGDLFFEVSMHRGYIKLWRKIVDWSWYKDANTLSLFIHLLIKSNHKDTIYMGQSVLRGSCVCGRLALAKDLGISERSVRTALNHLKSTNDVTIKTTNKFSIVCIANYSEYQDISTNRPTNKASNDRPTTDQQPTTSKECKNVRMKERERFSPPSLEAVKAYVAEISAGIDPETFISHYEAKGWMIGKSPMKNWKAAVVTWKRREFKNTTPLKNPNKKLVVV